MTEMKRKEEEKKKKTKKKRTRKRRRGINRGSVVPTYAYFFSNLPI